MEDPVVDYTNQRYCWEVQFKSSEEYRFPIIFQDTVDRIFYINVKNYIDTFF